ncbi:MAG: hypothetical protein K8I27_09660 [Planctomycetes bacterium]|nr:hypothetical protein [Planctomycetota bacterium]
MITKQHLIDSMLWEIRIIKHLATKIPPGGMSYRPSPQQRSMLELMRYLTTCAIVPAIQAVTGNWDHAGEMGQAAEQVNQQNFDRAMTGQGHKLKELVNGISSHDFANKQAAMPWGAPCTVGQGIMDMCLKALVAYRMQFFLYVKAAGRKDIGVAQCWVGVDPRPQPAQS